MSEMKTEMDDGGTAFPVTDPSGNVYSGMSLRDYLAAHAPISIEIAMEMLNVRSWTPLLDGEVRANVFEKLASMRNEYADAMLKARNQP